MAINTYTRGLAWLRRRPLVLLLLVATLVVDVLAVTLMLALARPNIDFDFLIVAVLYGLLGQLGVVTVWATSRWSRWVWRWTLVAPAVVAIAAVGIVIDRPSAAWSELPSVATLIGGFAISAIAGMLVVRAFAGRLDGKRIAPRRFSLASVLALMTFVAVMVTLLRHAELGNVSPPIFGQIALEGLLVPACWIVNRLSRRSGRLLLLSALIGVWLMLMMKIGDTPNGSLRHLGFALSLITTQCFLWFYAVSEKRRPM